MNINEIITSLSTFRKEGDIKNSNYKNRYQELENIVRYCCDVWNNIVYAFKKINQEVDFDPRFYYQSIIFNLNMLGNITSVIGGDILENDIKLKDLRDNIAHMDEKIKKQLNFIDINDIYPNAITQSNGVPHFNVSLCGLQIIQTNTKYLSGSPLGIIDDVVYSSLQPTEKRSTYNTFVSYKITEENLNKIQEKLLNLLLNYFQEIKLKPTGEGLPLISFKE